MNFQSGYIVEVTDQDGVTKWRGTVTEADQHNFKVEGHGWSMTFPQDTNQVTIFSWG